jgi:hypothetical protein
MSAVDWHARLSLGGQTMRRAIGQKDRKRGKDDHASHA